MAQYSKSPKPQSAKGGKLRPVAGEKYVDRNLASMSPAAAQEACKPTDADPVRLQARMKGVC